MRFDDVAELASLPDDIAAHAKGHEWTAVVALVIWAGVRLSKNDKIAARFPWSIPPRWRPWAALGAGAVFGFCKKLALGGSWFEGIGGGIFAGISAMAGHDLIVDGLRKGRDIGIKKVTPPTPPPSHPPPPVVVVLLLLLCRCSPAVSPVVGESALLVVNSDACRRKGLAIAREDAGCESRRQRLLDLRHTDPECLGLYEDAGAAAYTCSKGTLYLDASYPEADR